MIDTISTTHVVALIGIAISAVVALLVASQNRRQARQIELYKNDPSVGLTPPASAITRLVKSHWLNVLSYGMPSLALFVELQSSSPITRGSVLVISLSVSALTVNLVLFAVGRVISSVVGVIKDHVAKTKEMGATILRLVENHVEATKEITDVIGVIVPSMDSLVKATKKESAEDRPQ